MRPLILYIAASIDGYIAKTDGGIDWLHNPELSLPNEDYGYQDLYDSIDTTLMGNTTYKKIASFDIEFPYKDKINYVFTRKKYPGRSEFVAFVNKDIVNFVKELKKKQGKSLWLIGGGEINGLMLNHALIDKIILTRIPVILGAGIPLFGLGTKECKVKMIHSHVYDNGVIKSTFLPSI